MKETKTILRTPEARAVMHEVMAAFEPFKGANDAWLDEIENDASAEWPRRSKNSRRCPAKVSTK